MVDQSYVAERKVTSSGPMALMGAFTISIFLSAFLLFSVQPMFTKLVLPLLGGSSSVWNTAMVFFQAMLLGGYVYAHLISKHLSLAKQIIGHGLVLGAGLLFLPLSIASGWTPPENGAQAYWLLGLFTVSVGVPFFAISANAPLLQRWFSRTDHKDSEDPYFLYAASNAGSLLSLCLYPILFEPLLKLREQTSLWSWGYVVLIASILFAGVLAYRRLSVVEDIHQVAEAKTDAETIGISRRLKWIFWAFIPSSLMLGVTTYMSSAIGSTPFLWILPLALYLLTFIIVFAKNPIVTSERIAIIFPAVILVAVGAGTVLKEHFMLAVILSLVSFFLVTLMAHLRLAEDRPGVSKLTEFYIFMSLGGVLGGIFNALVAPVIFSGVWEYMIILVVSIFAVKQIEDNSKSRGPFSRFFFYCLLPIWSAFALVASSTDWDILKVCFFFGSALVLGISYWYGRGKAMIGALSALTIFTVMLPNIVQKPVLLDRSFYSVLTVSKGMTKDSKPIHKFVHGNTLHNMQLLDEDLQTRPLVYHGIGSGFDHALTIARKNRGNIDVAMIGLGAGAVACYEKPGDKWTYMEIDKKIVDMALDPKYFTYMDKCSIEKNVIVGDARLTINQVEKASLDLLIIDAFTGNSIPSHLVTTEAFTIYQDYLKSDGLIFFHTSNRHLDITSVVVRAAENLGLSTRAIKVNDFSAFDYPDTYADTEGVLIGSHAGFYDLFEGESELWKDFIPSENVGVWSDDYSSVLGTLKSRMNNEGKFVETKR